MTRKVGQRLGPPRREMACRAHGGDVLLADADGNSDISGASREPLGIDGERVHRIPSPNWIRRRTY
jgi:hypothetical protein